MPRRQQGPWPSICNLLVAYQTAPRDATIWLLLPRPCGVLHRRMLATSRDSKTGKERSILGSTILPGRINAVQELEADMKVYAHRLLAASMIDER